MAEWTRDRLVATLRGAGCDDSEGWADSQIEEDIPQLARFLLCKTIWEHAMEPWRRKDALAQYADTAQLITDGADADALRRLGGKIAYETMTVIVNAIDQEMDVGEADVPADAPGWMVVDGETMEPTGRNSA